MFLESGCMAKKQTVSIRVRLPMLRSLWFLLSRRLRRIKWVDDIVLCHKKIIIRFGFVTASLLCCKCTGPRDTWSEIHDLDFWSMNDDLTLLLFRFKILVSDKAKPDFSVSRWQKIYLRVGVNKKPKAPTYTFIWLYSSTKFCVCLLLLEVFVFGSSGRPYRFISCSSRDYCLVVVTRAPTNSTS